MSDASAGNWTEFAQKLLEIPSAPAPQVAECTEEEVCQMLNTKLKALKSKKEPGGERAALEEERHRILAALSPAERDDFLRTLETVKLRQQQKMEAFSAGSWWNGLLEESRRSDADIYAVAAQSQFKSLCKGNRTRR